MGASLLALAKSIYYTFINEPGFYELVFNSKLEVAKRFRQWVFSTVLPSMCKYGQYKLFDSPWNKMIMIAMRLTSIIRLWTS